MPISAQAKANLTFTVPKGALFGPYALLAQANFLVKDPVSGANFLETARHLAVLDVLPDSGQSETALYWVSLECWLPDWQ
jgi:hypothetical protein